MAPIDQAPLLTLRLTVAVECPHCRAVPSTTNIVDAFGRDYAQPVLQCLTCGQVHRKQLWLRLMPWPAGEPMAVGLTLP